MRKEKIITILDGDVNKNFKITQMSAFKQEKWLNRVILLAVCNGGISSLIGGFSNANTEKLEQEFINGGGIEKILETIASFDYEKIEPLYNELLECCAYIPDESNMNFSQPLTAKNADSMIESFKTLYRLRIEALKLNFDFFGKGEASPISGQPMKTGKKVIKRI